MYPIYLSLGVYTVAQSVQALRYKPEGCEF